MNRLFENKFMCSLFRQHNWYVISVIKDGKEEAQIEECYNCKKIRKLVKKWVVQ